MTTVGQALVDRLGAHGVEVVFGIPGVHTIELYRGLAASGIRHVTPRHEQGAGFMADGYARVSGRPGVAFIITGPGLTNILTPMGQALADSVPILVVSGVNRRDSLGQGRGMLHELPDQLSMVRGAAVQAEQVSDPGALFDAVDRAVSALGAARPGPVHLEIPTDVMPLPCDPGRPLPDPAPAPVPGIARLAERLVSVRRPVILAGGGAARSADGLRAVAERLDAPVVLTVNGRGLMHGHPLGVPASPSLGSVRDLIEDADLVLALGTELGPTDYDMYATGSLPDFPPMIRVDICPEKLARYPAEIALQGRVEEVTTQLRRVLPDRRGGGTGAARADAARAAARAELAGIAPVYPDLVTLLETLRDSLPGAILVGDSTQLTYAGNLFFDHDRPGGWFNGATGFGALGYAIPAAIGAAVAEPAAQVVALTGDGGAQFTLPEMMVAVEERLPILFVVWNNAAYLEIGAAMRESGIEVVGCDPMPPKFDHVAAACSMPHRRIRPTPAELRAALADLLPLDGPALLEIDAIPGKGA